MSETDKASDATDWVADAMRPTDDNLLRIISDIDEWLATGGPVVPTHLASVSERLRARVVAIRLQLAGVAEEGRLDGYAEGIRDTEARLRRERAPQEYPGDRRSAAINKEVNSMRAAGEKPDPEGPAGGMAGERSSDQPHEGGEGSDGHATVSTPSGVPAAKAAQPPGPDTDSSRADSRDIVLSRLAAWAHEYGAALKPKGADTYGEGVRDCKAQVALILSSLGSSASEKK